MSQSRRNHEGHREHHQSHHQTAHHNSHTAMNHSSRPKDYVKSTSSDDETETSAISRFFFGLLWCFAQVGLWGSVLLLLYWFLKFDQGFAWQNERAKMFNLHAFLLLTGFIFFNGQAMLIYKTFLCCKKIYNKIAHTIFFVLSTSLITFGLIVGIQAQHMSPPDVPAIHFYSIHSWIGLVTVGLFALQFLFGFVTFLVLLCCDKATASFRTRVLPTHQTIGLTIYSLAAATVLAGLLQTARSRLKEPQKPDYKFQTSPTNPFLNAGMVINMVGACVIAAALIMPYIVRNFAQRRNQASFSVN